MRSDPENLVEFLVLDEDDATAAIAASWAN
jgi:hypothetical protein